MTAELTNDILQALLQATCEQKRAALQILRDEPADYPSSEPLLTLKQLSAKLNFHPSTLWRWQVPRHGFAGRPRFRLSEVLAYLESMDFQKRADELRREREEGPQARAAKGGES